MSILNVFMGCFGNHFAKSGPAPGPSLRAPGGGAPYPSAPLVSAPVKLISVCISIHLSLYYCVLHCVLHVNKQSFTKLRGVH